MNSSTLMESDETSPDFPQKLVIDIEEEEVTAKSTAGDHLAVENNVKDKDSLKASIKSNIEDANHSDQHVVAHSISDNPENCDNLHHEVTWNNNKSFTCACGEQFEKSTQLAAHSRWSCKLKEKVAQCTLCDTWFASFPGLRRHMKHVHGGAVKCDRCPLRFQNKIKLTRHWIQEHYDDDDRLLKCLVCDVEGFSTKYDLECHLIAHKYERCKNKQAFDLRFSSSNSTTSSQPNTPCSGGSSSSSSRHISHTSLSSNNVPNPVLHPHHIPQMIHPHPRLPPPAPVLPPLQQFASGNGSPLPASNNVGPRHDHPLDPSSMYWHPHRFKRWGGRHMHHRHHDHHGHHHPMMKFKRYIKLLKMNAFAKYHSETKDQPNSSTNAEMPCPFCNKSSLPNAECGGQQHEKNCPTLSLHRCHVCDKLFRKKHFLIKHMHEQNHFLLPNDEQDSGRSSPVSSSLHTDTSSLAHLQHKLNSALNLKDCNSTTDSSITTQSFLTTHAEMGPSKVSKTTSCAAIASGTRTTLSQDSSKTHKCDVCRSFFKKKSELADHLREHINHVVNIQTILKVHEWSEKSSGYLVPSQEISHNMHKSDSSTVSGQDSELTSTTANTATTETSSRFSSLETHVNEIVVQNHHQRKGHHRAKGEVHMCLFCNKTFQHKKKLKAHMKEDHKESMLECPICHKQFSSQKRGKFFERHVNSHYGIKVFNHKCEECGKTFLEKSKLKAHMAVHRNDPLFKCSVCGKGYGNKSSLVRHERKHTGMLPYECEVCHERFNEKRELVRHSATHTGIAPFTCKHCSRGFTLKTSLMTHIKKKHPDLVASPATKVNL